MRKDNRIRITLLQPDCQQRKIEDKQTYRDGEVNPVDRAFRRDEIQNGGYLSVAVRRESRRHCFNQSRQCARERERRPYVFPSRGL
jgi:hypothetical protein